MSATQSMDAAMPLRRCVLVTAEMVRACRGLNGRHVRQQIEEGKLQWVWDISMRSAERGVRNAKRAARHCKELRFWAREVIAPELCILLSAEAVVDLVLGSERQQWSAAELEHLLLCSKQHAHALLRGPLKCAGRGLKRVSRERLRAFLLERLHHDL